MARPQIRPTGREATFGNDEIIVSKTDLRGHITYANDIFLRVSGYSETELIGQPHNVIRHPDMPACVFELLWDTIKSQNEIFAYVLNLAKDGDHYWVFAHVTPSYNFEGQHTGFHSNRRVPHEDALAKVKTLYANLRAEELKSEQPREGMKKSRGMMESLLQKQGLDYSQFVFSLSTHTQLESVGV